MEQARGVVNKDAWRRSTRELQPYGSNDDPAALTTATEGSGRGSGRDERGHTTSSPVRGTKRTTDQDAEEEEGTEVDEDEDPPSLDDPHPSSTMDEFPAVFTSPHLTQPELFARPALPRPKAAVQGGRQMRGLPTRGRHLGKTVSAPVFGHGFGGAGAQDVDMDMEDGFDISEWAKEEF